jgi:hypothetical protein
VRKAFQHVAQRDVVETPFDGSIIADLKKVWTFCTQRSRGVKEEYAGYQE